MPDPDAATAEQKPTVAVVGLGGMGLVTVKNLLEEGFRVTGFDRSAYVGGLWHFSEDPETLSVLENTVANVTTDRGCFTDFPFPPGTPIYPSAKQVEAYLESYADHFNLRPHLRLGTGVEKVLRDEDEDGDDDTERWCLRLQDGREERFDKVVVATGPHAQPIMPEFEGRGEFAGEILHSKAFKRPEAYRGKKVLLVGLGNTTGDVADSLVGVADSVYIAHNHGAYVFSRHVNGSPTSRLLTQRRQSIQALLERWFPDYTEGLVNKKARALMRATQGELDPAWGLEPCPSMRVTVPVVSDTLVSHLRSGAVRSVPGVRRLRAPSTVELLAGEGEEEGEVLEGVDAVICCTGFRNDYSILSSFHDGDGRFDPSADPPPEWLRTPGSRGRPLPRLYQNVFSLEAPGSLAFVGSVWFATGAFFVADMASMCVAQVWAGKARLPPRARMEAWADGHARGVARLARERGAAPLPAAVSAGEWLAWADETAGTGLLARTGWGWKGWVFWARRRRLWRMVVDGPLTSAAWRLFDEGRRRPWEGAEGVIERVNEEAARETAGRRR